MRNIEDNMKVNNNNAPNGHINKIDTSTTMASDQLDLVDHHKLFHRGTMSHKDDMFKIFLLDNDDLLDQRDALGDMYNRIYL